MTLYTVTTPAHRLGMADTICPGLMTAVLESCCAIYSMSRLVAWTALVVFVSASGPRTLLLQIRELVLCDFIDVVTYCKASLLDTWRLSDTV